MDGYLPDWTVVGGGIVKVVKQVVLHVPPANVLILVKCIGHQLGHVEQVMITAAMRILLQHQARYQIQPK
ncbi:hypothetical protein TYRP_004248 [Tyrophagus putrescentiae]|nr:hypothetical protein TYRP_004248 [Tyrophagus putrescentiae]